MPKPNLLYKTEKFKEFVGLMPPESYKNVLYHNCDFYAIDATKKDFHDVEFYSCRFDDMMFNKSDFSSVYFCNCSFSTMGFRGNTFNDVEFDGCVFEEFTEFHKGNGFKNVKFLRSNFASSVLDSVDFGGTHFTDCTGDGKYLKTLKINEASVTYTATHITIGNMTMTLDEWKELCTPVFSRFLSANSFDNRVKVWAEDLTLLNDLVARFPALPTNHPTGADDA